MRQPLPQLSVASMADIAFMLLIFWLLTSTLNTDEGIKRFLPPLVENTRASETPERNVLQVLTNANDELLVNGEDIAIEDLRQRVIDFLISNGDGITVPLASPKEGYPIREMVSKSEVEGELTLLHSMVDEQDHSFRVHDKREALKEKLKELDLLGQYAALPKSAVISVKCDRASTYDLYIAIQNEIEAALRIQRDAVAMKVFGMLYTEMEAMWKENPEMITLGDQIRAVRAVYPYVISESETVDRTP